MLAGCRITRPKSIGKSLKNLGPNSQKHKERRIVRLPLKEFCALYVVLSPEIVGREVLADNYLFNRRAMKNPLKTGESFVEISSDERNATQRVPKVPTRLHGIIQPNLASVAVRETARLD